MHYLEQRPHRHVAPATTSSFNPATNAIYNANQTVTLTASDTSGVRCQGHLLQDRQWRDHHLHDTFTISGDATHTFSYWSVDNATNKETTHTSNVFRIDTTPPTTVSNAASSYNGTATVSLTATDGVNGSGVANTYYKVDGGAQTRHRHHDRPAGIGHHHAHHPVLVGGQRHQQGDDRESRRS